MGVIGHIGFKYIYNSVHTTLYLIRWANEWMNDWMNTRMNDDRNHQTHTRKTFTTLDSSIYFFVHTFYLFNSMQFYFPYIHRLLCLPTKFSPTTTFSAFFFCFSFCLLEIQSVRLHKILNTHIKCLTYIRKNGIYKYAYGMFKAQYFPWKP